MLTSAGNVITIKKSELLEEAVLTSLQKLRKSRGVTQRDLADATGLTERTVSLVENNPGATTAKTLKKLADFYDVTVDEVLGRNVNH